MTGNQIDIRHSHNDGEVLPAGILLAIVAMANGAGDPDIDAVWAVIGDTPFRTIVLGFSEAATIAKVKTELDDRWGPLRMLESVAYAARSGTRGTLAAFGAALNSELVSVFGSGKSPSWSPEAAAIYAADCGYYSAIDPAPFRGVLPLPRYPRRLPSGVVGRRYLRERCDMIMASEVAPNACTSVGCCA